VSASRAQPLTVPRALAERFGLGTYEAMRRQDRAPLEMADRKGRELYVGNLTIGFVTSAMLVELFTVPLQKLPLGDNGQLIQTPCLEAKVDSSGKFAFVLFSDDRVATMALAIFNKMELCGRPLCVDRPAGYTPDMSRPLPPGMLESGMPTGGTGAPPDKAMAAMMATQAAVHSAAQAGGLPAPPSGVGVGVGVGLPAAPTSKPPPTRHLCLKNLLSPDALKDEKEFHECVEEIRDEVAGYGELASLVCPREGDLCGYSTEDIGSCFVRFEKMTAAVKAQDELDGREFDAQKVIALFLPE
jgi:hypothetical protein